MNIAQLTANQQPERQGGSPRSPSVSSARRANGATEPPCVSMRAGPSREKTACARMAVLWPTLRPPRLRLGLALQWDRKVKMARGWESKSVEEQIESAQSRPARGMRVGIELNAAQISLVREKENLMLSRTRVLHEIESSKNPRYVKLLNRELK